MATRFLRLDLSDEARDFRPIAVEPGVPMLDKANANAKILFRWLGGLVAEPVWEGDSVSFFVRDDYGGRLEDVVCQPATAEDLEKLLHDDLEALKDRIAKARPETPTERAVKETVQRSFKQLTEEPGRPDLDCYFFRFRDVQGRWRLVWCWGYQRVDQEPAPAVICTDPECNLLFVRRPGGSHKCPSCEAALAARPAKKRPWRRRALTALILVLVIGALVYWRLHPPRLAANPASWTGPVGGRVEFEIVRAGLLPFLEEDVTGQVVGVVLDPAVARFDQPATAATLVGPGITLLRLHHGDLKTDVTLVAAAPKDPENVIIDPGEVKLAVGTTARVRLFGEYPDGTRVELTEAAEWTAQNDGIVFFYDGLLEGLAEGETTVGARYRATSEGDYLEATAKVNVVDAKLSSLEVAIKPAPVGAGRASRLRVDAVSDRGERYSVLESSRLAMEVAPRSLASVEGRRLRGLRPGKGTLAVSFDDSLNAGKDFAVEVTPGLDGLTVTPRQLRMVLGEIADLNVLSPNTAPIRVASRDAAVVEVTDENRLIARGPGKATVEVVQGDQERRVEVSVIRGEFQAIQVDPPRLVVPVDHAVPARVLGLLEGGRRAEIAPGLLACPRRPSPRYAEFDVGRMRLHGIAPTDPSVPQTLAFRFRDHEAAAPVEVVLAPFRLALSPAGPVDLPLGQQVRLQGRARYTGRHTVQVPAGRLELHAEPSDERTAAALAVRGDKVAALSPGGGPLSVHASYLGRKSKPVVFRSVEAGPVRLRLEVDRALRLAGEPGRVALLGTGPKGDVDLVADLAEYESSDPDVLQIDEKTGAFRALAAGQATTTARHAASRESATLKLEVFDPADAKLAFEPESLKVHVGEVGRLQLYLEVQDGRQVRRAALEGPGVGYAIGRPEAVRWSPPILVGQSPAAAFPLRASYYPVLSRVATAEVEVLPAVEPEAIRVVPSQACLAPGQTLPLKVEQELPGRPQPWRELSPEAVHWTVPRGLIWVPAGEGLRPTATIPPQPPGEFELRAHCGGKQAAAVLATKQSGPDPGDPAAKVLLVREPKGQYLPVGARQRYSVVVEKDGAGEPVAEVTWPGDFENQYVLWQAPVLRAKKAGYEQWLRAEVDGRALRWRTVTYQPGRFQRPPPREDAPVAVKILSDQGPSVRFPVGARFDDFRVEAHYADGFTRLVTKKATLRTPDDPRSAPLTAMQGRLLGVRPGRTTVAAEFEGLRSEQSLEVEVTAGLDMDELRLAPDPVTIQPGETCALEVRAYRNGKSVGVINGLDEIRFRSSDPQVASVDGPSVTGVAVGQASVNAELNGIASPPARVDVVGALEAALAVDPPVLRIRVGESAHIGTELSVFRGPRDVSRPCAVTPALPGVVEYLPETHSLVGRSPGASAVAFTLGDSLANAVVEVLPSDAPIDGQVVVEPSTGNLVPGQALPLQVFVLTPGGRRVDRTAAAVLASSDPGKVTIQGNLACGVAPGSAEITASLPGTQNTGKAHLTVGHGEIAELIVEPSRLLMYPGQSTRLRILGRAQSGTYEIFSQPDLSIEVGGPSPEAVQVVGPREIGAVKPGQATLAVDWQGRLGAEVPVSVTDDDLSDLRIEPGRAVIHPGQPLVYQVTGVQGGLRRVLGPEDGVELFLGNPSVAQVAAGELAVRAVAPGHTTVLAGVGGQRAEASLEVTPGTQIVGGPGLLAEPGGVEYYGPGGGYYGGPGGYWHAHHGYWDGGRWVHVPGSDHVESVHLRAPAEPATLRFVPEVLRLAAGSPPTGVRLLEVLADGSHGRDVTADANLQLAPPHPTGVVAVERTTAGPLVRPLGKGRAWIGAKLGELTAEPLLVSVVEASPRLARLTVAPDPLTVWAGEVGSFGSVLLDPGPGQAPRAVDYRVTPARGQGVVESAGDQTVRGLSPGVTQVVVSTVDPSGVYDGLSTRATVRVIRAPRIWITPPALSLKVGQRTPPMSVMAAGDDGLAYQVPAGLQSMDHDVLAAAPDGRDRFVAKALGTTQLRAAYRGAEAFADVTVQGQWFLEVNEVKDSFNGGAEDFDIALKVLADPSEGPLEYRIYAAGQTPAENWTEARLDGGSRRVVLRSPRLPYGPPNSLYHLILEARAPSGGGVRQYPFSFRLKQQVERADSPVGNP